MPPIVGQCFDLTHGKCTGMHEVFISIECRDSKRPADVSWIEEMKSKHERLATSELILVSRSGFTKQAIEIAQKYGIKPFALKDLKEDSIKKLFGNSGSLWAKSFSLSTTKVMIGLMETNGLPEEFVVVHPDIAIFNNKGEEIASVKELVTYILHLHQVVMDLAKMGDESHKGFEIRLDFPKDGFGNPLCLEKKESRILRRMRFLHIIGSCNFTVSELRLKSSMLKDVRVDWGIESFFGKPAMIVATKDQSCKKRLSITLEDITVVRSEFPED